MNGADRSLASFTGLGHGTMHGYELAIPVFVPLWLAEFDVSATVLGAVAAVGFAMLGIAAPLAGALADRYGSRRLVLVSVGGMGLAYATLGLVDGIVGLGIALFLWGIAASLYHPAGLSLISRTADRRGAVLAVHGVGGNVGTVVVPLLAVVMLAVTDWRTTALVLAALALVPLSAGFWLSIEERQRSSEPTPLHPLALLRRNRGLLVGGFAIVVLVQLLYGTYYRGVVTFLPDVLGDLPVFNPITVGEVSLDASQLAYMVLLLVGAVGQYAGGMASDRVRPERTLVAILGALVVLAVVFVPATSLGAGAVILVCAALGLFLFAVAPVAQHLVAEYATVDRHGASFGLVYFGTFGVGAAGAALAGAMLDVGGQGLLFATLALVALAAAGVATILLARERRREGPTRL